MNKKAFLENLGVKTTPQRLAVLEIFLKLKKPLDITALSQKLKEKTREINRATVFRTVNLFVKTGIIQRIELSEGKYRYELSDQPHHHHAVCLKCGTVKDVEDCETVEIEKKIKQQLNFQIQTHRLEFFGTCRSCQ